MRSRVDWSDQVAGFVAALAPEPKRKLRQAIRGLAEGRGDIKPLQDQLAGYSRLRVGGYRVVFRETSEGAQRVVKCLFAQRREVVYELFQEMILDDLA